MLRSRGLCSVAVRCCAAGRQATPVHTFGGNLVAWRGAAGGVPPGGAPPGGGNPASPPGGIIGPSGAPITGAAPRGGSAESAAGPIVELTPQNAMQILNSQSAMLLQSGGLPESIGKKITRLREAAQGRLPLVVMEAAKLPQIAQALQIKTEPTVLLVARGQVAAALEGDLALTPQGATGFVERVAQLLGLQVNLAEGATEQLAEAEELEWRDAAASEEIFTRVNSVADLPTDARARAAAGLARCMIRVGRREDAKEVLKQLESSAHGRMPEVKQAAALLQLDERRPKGTLDAASTLDSLRTAAEAAPNDHAAVEAYAVGLFWGRREVDAFEAGLALLRKKKSDETQQLVLLLVDALGPRHPKAKSARRAFGNALFV
eukprot:gnl/TRDRNA2_/TRDRNA2_135858_c0_seq3.p1 gnl/TRDRNA2_/TRDRNA2_135858_c0~~gnl/TRDRNA2_/TRDRNA2_135858_c0_seq3.p1  ORF type:complete len:377 (+),score=92.59 gnl/TRDRNA2_/TRDRNA2_135858_c0_seq3:79-1209(+)